MIKIGNKEILGLSGKLERGGGIKKKIRMGERKEGVDKGKIVKRNNKHANIYFWVTDN